MPILATDLEVRLSIKTGSAGNTVAQGSGALSLGGWVSTTLAPVTLNALFPELSREDNAAGTLQQYLCLFLVNKHASLTWRTPKGWLNDPANGAAVAMGIDPTAASPLGASVAQAVSVANITTAPAGVTFSAPTSEGAGLPVLDVPPGYVKGFWIRRSAQNAPGLPDEGPLFSFVGGTLG